MFLKQYILNATALLCVFSLSQSWPLFAADCFQDKNDYDCFIRKFRVGTASEREVARALQDISTKNLWEDPLLRQKAIRLFFSSSSSQQEWAAAMFAHMKKEEKKKGANLFDNSQYAVVMSGFTNMLVRGDRIAKKAAINALFDFLPLRDRGIHDGISKCFLDCKDSNNPNDAAILDMLISLMKKIDAPGIQNLLDGHEKAKVASSSDASSVREIAIIRLRDGETIRGDLIESNDEYVKIYFEGIPLTYYVEDISSYERQQVIKSDTEQKQGTVVISIKSR